MKITTVEYRRLRTIEGAYENETIGAVAEVEGWETPSEALANLAEFVNLELSRRLSDRRVAEDGERMVSNARWELEQVNRDIESARERWALIQEFVKKFGVDLNDIPF